MYLYSLTPDELTMHINQAFQHTVEVACNEGDITSEQLKKLSSYHIVAAEKTTFIQQWIRNLFKESTEKGKSSGIIYIATKILSSSPEGAK